jgi:hypothetical protein
MHQTARTPEAIKSFMYHSIFMKFIDAEETKIHFVGTDIGIANVIIQLSQRKQGLQGIYKHLQSCLHNDKCEKHGEMHNIKITLHLCQMGSSL